MSEGPQAPLPPALQRLKDELHGAWREEEDRGPQRSRRRRAAIAAGMATAAISVMIVAGFIGMPSTSPSLSLDAALAAQGSAPLGDWRLALVRRGDTLCMALRTTGENAASGRLCDTAFPSQRPLTTAVARSQDEIWVYGLSTASIRDVTIRIRDTERTVRTFRLRNEALRGAQVSSAPRGFLVTLQGVAPGRISVSGSNLQGQQVAVFARPGA